MDALKTRYQIVKAANTRDRPDYTFYVMRKGAQTLPADCPICQFEGNVGVVAAVEVSEKGNNYQLCNRDTHQFFWNKPAPTIDLPGRDPAPRAERQPNSRVKDCSEYGCKRRVSAQCGNRMCLQSCLQWATDKYNEGYNPLDMCRPHRPEILLMVKQSMDGEAVVGEAIGVVEPDIPVEEEWEAYALGDDGEVIPPPQPPLPIPQPPALQPMQRLRGPAPAPAQPVGVVRRARLPLPQPQPALPAPAQARPLAPRRVGLAQPVAPLPAALPLNANPYQTGDVRIQRQRHLQMLQRTTREDTADTLTRRTMASMWRASGEHRLEAVTNTKTMRDCFVPSDHPTIVEFFKNDGVHPPILELYDWGSKEWITSGPDVPHPLAGRSRILIRDTGMLDAQCAGLGVRLEEDVIAAGNTGVEVKGGVKRKHSTSAGASSTKGRGIIVKTESTPSRPPSSLAPSPPLSAPSTPESTLPSRKKRRMNAKSKSWIMSESYKVVSEALMRVQHLRDRKGYEIQKAIQRGFRSEKHLPKSTYNRHYTFYLAVDPKHRTQWEINHQDRLWAEFWEEFKGVEEGIKEEDEDADGEGEGEGKGKGEEDVENAELERMVLGLNGAPGAGNGVVKEEPVERVELAIKSEEDIGDGILVNKQPPIGQNMERAAGRMVTMELDDSDDSDIALPGPSHTQATAHLDIKPITYRRASTSKGHMGKEPYIPKGTVIEIASTPEPGDDEDDPITISD